MTDHKSWVNAGVLHLPDGITFKPTHMDDSIEEELLEAMTKPLSVTFPMTPAGLAVHASPGLIRYFYDEPEPKGPKWKFVDKENDE